MFDKQQLEGKKVGFIKKLPHEVGLSSTRRSSRPLSRYAASRRLSLVVRA